MLDITSSILDLLELPTARNINDLLYDGHSFKCLNKAGRTAQRVPTIDTSSVNPTAQRSTGLPTRARATGAARRDQRGPLTGRGRNDGTRPDARSYAGRVRQI